MSTNPAPFLRSLHQAFDPDASGAWAQDAVVIVRSLLPDLSSSSAVAQEGFQEALMALRDALDAFQPDNPEANAFELCDRIADVLEYFAQD